MLLRWQALSSTKRRSSWPAYEFGRAGISQCRPADLTTRLLDANVIMFLMSSRLIGFPCFRLLEARCVFSPSSHGNTAGADYLTCFSEGERSCFTGKMLVSSPLHHSLRYGTRISSNLHEPLTHAGIRSDWAGCVVVLSSVAFGLLQRPTAHA